MIISRSPLRVSLFGGGTDFPEWFKKNDGLVIGGAINKYSYIHVRYLPDIFKFNYRLRYFKTELVKKINNIKHGPYREILKIYNLDRSQIEIIHTSDLPALSGLGSSSSSTVSAINAISALKGSFINKKNLSNLAIKIEREILGENVGCQDQIFSSFGGFNCIRFKSDVDFSVENLINSKKKLSLLNNSSILIWSGIQRESQILEKEKISKIKNKSITQNLKNIQSITEKAYQEFSKSNWDLKEIGELMNEYWQQKKTLSSSITNKKIDQICNIANTNGAYGVKLLGAGGGGFIYVLCAPKKKKNLLKKLSKFANVDFQFENSGSSIIYNKQLI
jgi:D-glycero-alpha-D-manno-heptose-7-phosphate kinase